MRDAGGAPGWCERLVRDPRFRRWAARFPLTRSHVRHEGEAIFDIVSGFAQSQVLRVLVELRVLHLVEGRPREIGALARELPLPDDRAEILIRGGVALGLLRLSRGRVRLSLRGAALLGVPGLEEMIRHHDILYRDLSDPVAFFRGEVETELAGFWPYVFGQGGEAGAEDSARYSRLMAESQILVAEDTLAAIDLRGVSRLVDVGGGTGMFLAHVAGALPHADLVLFDLPQVMGPARAALEGQGLGGRITFAPGNFRHDDLPEGADAITLVRVLYDHPDVVVRTLLSRARAALSPGGRLIVSEPMTGGDAPHVAGDIYFALYCMAMRTGRARAPGRIAELLREAGFGEIRIARSSRPFVTSVVEGRAV
ncbi:methyltransferase [Palleronia sp. LCG004]|uniref:methyltransferase n=1 Tax=Palleronia sp. LCG004 TaxID=3079304 RepID=UPI0029435485|nr:methyltransferase [Palleronia sp. LCG004]WOI56112.1 methyltransferase [Palleronia sp. LCG004]